MRTAEDIADVLVPYLTNLRSTGTVDRVKATKKSATIHLVTRDPGPEGTKTGDFTITITARR